MIEQEIADLKASRDLWREHAKEIMDWMKFAIEVAKMFRAERDAVRRSQLFRIETDGSVHLVECEKCASREVDQTP